MLHLLTDKPRPAIQSYQGAEYMVPTAYVIMESIPLTPNGKVDRRALPRTYIVTFDRYDYVAPRSQVEELLGEIWAKAH